MHENRIQAGPILTHRVSLENIHDGLQLMKDKGVAVCASIASNLDTGVNGRGVGGGGVARQPGGGRKV